MKSLAGHLLAVGSVFRFLAEIGQRGRLAQGVASFAGTLASKVVQLKPYDPESKGIVERRNGWFETSFMPGRTFASPADFNAQLQEWLEKANSRVVRTIKARPVDLIGHDRARMLPLPPIPLQLAGENESDSDATTTSVSTPPSTPSTLLRLAGSSTSPPTWTE